MSDDDERSGSQEVSEEEEESIMLGQADMLSLDSTDEHSFVMPPKKTEIRGPEFSGNMLRDTKSTITGLITEGWVQHKGESSRRNYLVKRRFDTEESLYDNLEEGWGGGGNLHFTETVLDRGCTARLDGGPKASALALDTLEFRHGWKRDHLCPSGAWPLRQSQLSDAASGGSASSKLPTTYVQREDPSTKRNRTEEEEWDGGVGREKAEGQGVEQLIPICKHDAIQWVPVESVLRPSVTLHAPAVPQAIANLVSRSLRASLERAGGSRPGAGGTQEEGQHLNGDVPLQELVHGVGMEALEARGVLGREVEGLVDAVVHEAVCHWAERLTSVHKRDKAWLTHSAEVQALQRRQEASRRVAQRTGEDLANWYDMIVAADTFALCGEAARGKTGRAAQLPKSLLSKEVVQRAKARLAAMFDPKEGSAAQQEVTGIEVYHMPRKHKRKAAQTEEAAPEQADD